MSVIRISKSKNYTVMSNIHLRDKNISLKAKGLLSVALSLPDDWNYSLSGLASICKESITAIRSAIKELCQNGYATVEKLYPEKDSGRSQIEYVYTFYEEPQNTERQNKGNQDIENLYVEDEHIEDVIQINTNKLNTDKGNTKKSNTDKLTTDINASNSEELEGEEEEDINAFVPDRTKWIPYLDMNNCTSDEIKNHYSIRCKRIAKKYNIKDSKTIDDTASTIEYFCKKYYETFSEPHPVLSDRALERVFINFCFPPELLYKNDVVTYDEYKNLIDRYFATEYGKYQLSGVVPDYSISHFMSEQILVNLCKNEFGIPHL